MRLFHFIATATVCCCFPAITLAVPYSLPTDGWYQLQDATSYAEVCSTADESCDVPAGNYVLINHSLDSNDPQHRQFINIAGAPTEDPPVDNNPLPSNAQFTIETTVVYENCLNGFYGKPTENDDKPCLARCPDGYASTGGSCMGTRADTFFNATFDGTRQVNVREPMLETPVPGGYACELDTESSYTPLTDRFLANNFTKVKIQAMAICSAIVSK